MNDVNDDDDDDDDDNVSSTMLWIIVLIMNDECNMCYLHTTYIHIYIFATIIYIPQQ